MKEIKETCYKGTRILLGDLKRNMIDVMIAAARSRGFTEISVPVIQFQDIYEKKVGEHNLHLMFKFEDSKSRKLCLAPEVTAVVQRLSQTYFKYQKDVKVFYIQECFRRENPQAGRYRQFTQFGLEIINPTQDYRDELIRIALGTILLTTDDGVTVGDFEVNAEVERGLDYYKEGKGFEIICNKLGAQKQICGGGAYEGGIGFAIGVDRLLLLRSEMSPASENSKIKSDE
jgi:histidyl-tRNA synthetase